MDKSEFEKRIAARAERKFDDQVSELARYIYDHPIGRKLKIKIGDKEITLANFGGNYGLLNQDGIENKNSSLTNLESVREESLKEYRQKEVDGILSQLESFNYLFTQQ